MGIPFAKALYSLGEYCTLVSGTVVAIVRKPPSWALVRNQFYDIGVQSLPVVSITGLSTGVVLAAQSFFQLAEYGLTSATGLMVTKAMMVELGPVLTAFMITGRVGAAMCAELGTMRVTEQIDALSAMAVNPLGYLVAPRFLAGLIMLPLLTVYSCFMGVIGGFVMAVGYYGMSASSFLDPLPIHINNFDFFTGIVKGFLFGIIIISIACYRGMTTRGGAQGVGRATTNSVVITYSVILIANFMLTVFLNSSYKLITHYIPWLGH